MAVDISGEERIEAPIALVWEALNDADVLKACIPGCEHLDKTTDTDLAAVVALKVGPLKARFKGTVRLSNLNPPHSYTLSGEGKGGLAGFAKGGADVALKEDGPDTTILTYSANADVGGKLAQFGGGVIAAASKRLASRFFSTLSETVGGRAAGQ